MDWIHSTAEGLREILAQQHWLEAWRPAIAATPDWALLAAGPAALVFLWLLLRLVWPKRVKSRTAEKQSDSHTPRASLATHDASQPKPPPATPAGTTEVATASNLAQPDQSIGRTKQVDAHSETHMAEVRGGPADATQGHETAGLGVAHSASSHEAQLAILGLIMGAIFSDGDFVRSEFNYLKSTVRKHPTFRELSDAAFEALHTEVAQQSRQEFPNIEAEGPIFRSITERMAFIDKRVHAVPATEARSIFGLVVGAAYADNRLTSGEFDFLAWLGIQLKLSRTEIDAIMQEAKRVASLRS